MFGTLRPHLCHLDRDVAAAYRRMYCGTCKALGDGYGLLARPLLSYDTVLLSAVVEALCQSPSQTDSCRCPLMPVAHRSILAPDSVAMRTAAAVQILLVDQWLADQQQDGRKSAALARPLTRRRVDDARRELATLGVDTHLFATLAARQLHAERHTRAFAAVAEPTASLLASIFGQIGRLPGAVAHVAPGTPHADTLTRLGHNLGVAIYALDALEDLQDDFVHGQFNPCIDRHGYVSRSRVDDLGTALEAALAAIGDAVALLPWQRHGAILRDILCHRFRRRCTAALATAKALAEQWRQRRPKRAAVPIRAFLAVWMLLVALWTWAARQVRMAHRRRAHRQRHRRFDGPSCDPPSSLAIPALANGSALTAARPLYSAPDNAPGGVPGAPGSSPSDAGALPPDISELEEKKKPKQSADNTAPGEYVGHESSCCDCCSCSTGGDGLCCTNSSGCCKGCGCGKNGRGGGDGGSCCQACICCGEGASCCDSCGCCAKGASCCACCDSA